MPNAVQHIRQSINKNIIHDLLVQNGARRITDHGDSYRSTCPLHHGDNPEAFVWNYRTGLWYCFTGCNTGGDIFSFIAEIYHYDQQTQFKALIQKTAEVLNLDITGMELGERASAYRRELFTWMEYMERKKNHNTNREFDARTLGTLYKLNSYRNFTQDTIEYFKSRYIQEFNRIAIPIYDENSILVGVTMRRLSSDSDEPKWLHRPKHIDTGNILYNYNNIPEHKDGVWIVEGCFDVWNVHQMLFEGTEVIPSIVATFGAHMTDEQEALILERFTYVTLAYDNDSAGHAATKKAIERLKHKVNLRILDLRNRKDVGEIEDFEEFKNTPIVPWHTWLETH